MRMKKLYTHHSIYLLFAVCWLSYFSAYLGRLNFTACIAAINEAENLSKLELGRVSSAFFVCYGGAQLFSGLLADRLRPRLLVAVGLLGGAAVNLGMALSSTAGQMAVLWAANGLLQSLVALVSQLTIFCGVRLWLGPAFLLAGVPAIWIASKAGKVEYEENRKVTEHRRTYQMLHDVLVSRETSLERGLFGYTQQLDEQYKTEFEKARRFQHGVRKRMFVRMKVTGVLCAVVSFVLLALLLSVFARGEMTVGLFIALACAALNLVGLLMGSLPKQAKELSASNAFLAEAAEFTGNIALLPPSCIRVKPEVNLAELKQRLKGGAIIPGARLVVRNNIQIK